MWKINDLTNQKFGRLTVIRQTEQREKNYVVWECVCDCNKNKTLFVSSRDLMTIRNINCGCIEFERKQAELEKREAAVTIKEEVLKTMLRLNATHTNYLFATRVYCEIFRVESDNGDCHINGFHTALCMLKEREKQALEYRYRDEKTLEATGELLNVSKSRAREIMLIPSKNEVKT